MLPRICANTKTVPMGEWILLYKMYISDGLWGLKVRDKDCFNFDYVLPHLSGYPVIVVVLLARQMGWVKIPGYFSCVNEKIKYLIN